MFEAFLQRLLIITSYSPELYNCSGRSLEEWSSRGEKWPILGNYLTVAGLVYIMIYTACLFAMWRLQMLQMYCYKIMFLIGCFDMMNLLLNSVICGYLAVTGAVFCSFPLFNYVHGALIMVFWPAASYMYMMLALNRVCQIGQIRCLRWLFQPHTELIWMVGLLVYSFAAGVVLKPCVFSSKLFAASFMPFISDDFEYETSTYKNPMHTASNILTSLTLLLSYGYLCVYIYKQSKSKHHSHLQLRIFLQSFLISVPIVFAAGGYSYFNHVAAPEWIIVSAHILWHHCSGVGALIYLTFNTQIRKFYFGSFSLGKTSTTKISTTTQHFTTRNPPRYN